MDAVSKTLEPASRALVWIDGVGGYLVCLGPKIKIGQAAPDVDLAILAGISRHHATLHRNSDGYVLDAVRPVAVNAQPIERAFLRSGDRLTLGSACQLLFHQAVPLSNSARLDLVSGQRWQHPVQAALLMAETLVFGPGPQAHVIVEELTRPLVLFRTRTGLAVSYAGNLSIGGAIHQGRGPVPPGARVSADGLSLTLENA